jgi:hypothetical protein
MQDENRCSSTHFWHIRGKRCVPLKCKHGRDSNSGVCLEILKIQDSTQSYNQRIMGRWRGSLSH